MIDFRIFIKKKILLSFIAGKSAEWCRPLEDSLVISYKMKCHLTVIDPAITLLGTYSKELRTYVPTKACTQMLRAALVTVDKFGNNQDVLQ